LCFFSNESTWLIWLLGMRGQEHEILSWFKETSTEAPPGNEGGTKNAQFNQIERVQKSSQLHHTDSQHRNQHHLHYTHEQDTKPQLQHPHQLNISSRTPEGAQQQL
jgi:hypothetical protein